jgi:hypothetical protein
MDINFEGLITFSNIIFLLCSSGIVISIAALAYLYLFDILRLQAGRMVVYLIFGSISIAVQYVNNPMQVYVAFISALLVTICSNFSLMRPVDLLSQWNIKDHYQMKLFYLLNVIWHGALAVIYQSDMFAFVSISMLMSFLALLLCI